MEHHHFDHCIMILNSEVSHQSSVGLDNYYLLLSLKGQPNSQWSLREAVLKSDQNAGECNIVHGLSTLLQVCHSATLHLNFISCVIIMLSGKRDTFKTSWRITHFVGRMKHTGIFWGTVFPWLNTLAYWFLWPGVNTRQAFKWGPGL